MNTTQHTPGPWKPLLQALAVCTDNSAPKQANICLMDKKSQNVDEETMRANARLIAAAPDLLAACQALLDYTYNTSQPCTAIREQARNAIAQATGNEIPTPAISENLNQPL